MKLKILRDKIDLIKTRCVCGAEVEEWYTEVQGTKEDKDGIPQKHIYKIRHGYPETHCHCRCGKKWGEH